MDRARDMGASVSDVLLCEVALEGLQGESPLFLIFLSFLKIIEGGAHNGVANCVQRLKMVLPPHRLLSSLSPPSPCPRRFFASITARRMHDPRAVAPVTCGGEAERRRRRLARGVDIVGAGKKSGVGEAAQPRPKRRALLRHCAPTGARTRRPEEEQ